MTGEDECMSTLGSSLPSGRQVTTWSLRRPSRCGTGTRGFTIGYRSSTATDTRLPSQWGVPTIYPAVWYRRADMYDLASAVRAKRSISAMWLDWQTVLGRRTACCRSSMSSRGSPDVRFIINGVGERRSALGTGQRHVCDQLSRSAVRQNRGSDGELSARARVHAFVAEPQRPVGVMGRRHRAVVVDVSGALSPFTAVGLHSGT